MKAKRTVRTVLVAWSALGLFAAGATAAGEPARTKANTAEQKADSAEEAPPRIQLAILLDTSGSMQGLINQARTQLWKIVNELATAEREGRAPLLHVALYEYGKSTIPRDEGYLRQIVPLTGDLDHISEELFALKTNGGQEYCGQVIDAATRGLAWSESDEDLKLIFIAGNEPFTQGSVPYKKACPAAVAKGIIVNTIFCGPEAEGVRTGWKDGAQLADGSFMHIDQNRQVAAVKTPFDKKLAELSGKINATYVVFGQRADRRKAAKRRVEQDKLAANAAPAAAAERAAFKASGRYATTNDLVAAVQAGKVKLEEIEDEKLPEELRKMSLEERKTHLAKKAKQRARIQAEINELNKKRKAYIARERRKQSETTDEETFDAAVIRAVREQAGRRQFRFERESP